VPCYYGTPGEPQHSGVPWRDVPIGTPTQPSQYVASPATMGEKTPHGVISAAPQGVTCPSVGSLVSGRCLTRLQSYLWSTGGSYYAPWHRYQRGYR
jgi:hypothetical protein